MKKRRAFRRSIVGSGRAPAQPAMVPVRIYILTQCQVVSTLIQDVFQVGDLELRDCLTGCNESQFMLRRGSNLVFSIQKVLELVRC